MGGGVECGVGLVVKEKINPPNAQKGSSLFINIHATQENVII